MIPIPYVIEIPGTAEEVSQFNDYGAKDEDQDHPGADGVCRAGDRFNVLCALKHHEMVPAEEDSGIIRQKNSMPCKIFACAMHVQSGSLSSLEAAGKRSSNGIRHTRGPKSSVTS